MFKSIQFRLVLVFILIILSVMMTVGTFIIGNVARFYYNGFMTQMKSYVFDEGFMEKLADASGDDDKISSLKKLLDASYGKIGVNSYRNYALLNGSDGSYLFGSDELMINSVDISSNILTAISGNIGDGIYENSKYIDCAYPLTQDGKVLYIIYVYETKDELNGFSNSMFATIMQALILGLFTAIILGYLLSRTITTPIKNITKRAEKLAKGEFEIGEPSTSKDEIGILSNTFRSMARQLKDTMFEIANQKTKLETIMKFSTDGIAAFDTDGDLLLINPTAKKYLSIYDDNVNFDTFFSNIFDDVTLGDFLYLNRDKQIIREAELDGLYLRFHFGSFVYSGQKAGGVIVDIQNMTKERKMELSRREFVANVSHELKTPLTTLKAYTETLREGQVDDETRAKFLDTIDRETDRMTRLVSDLLTLSRLDNGVFALNLRRARLEDILEDVCEKLQFEAKNKEQDLVFRIVNEIPILSIDSDKMEQVITNIVSNAIKYTPTGGTIKIFSSFISDKAVIRVTDNGIGIPPSDLERIFERFYRVDKGRSREQGGTGLGLAIAKEIINAHAGDISITSKLGGGTEILITLPFNEELM